MRHARLAPGWRAAPLPSGRRSRWVALNGFSSCHPPPQDLSWRNQLLQVIPNGKAGVAPVLVKHIDGGTVAPRVAVRHGQFNLITSRAYPQMLFDLEGDPLELSNIAGSVEATDTESHLLDLANHAWDLDSLAETVKRDQISRRIVHEGLGQRRREIWDFVPRALIQYTNYVLRGDSLPVAERQGYLPYAWNRESAPNAVSVPTITLNAIFLVYLFEKRF